MADCSTPWILNTPKGGGREWDLAISRAIHWVLEQSIIL